MRSFNIIGHQRGGHHAIANWILSGAEQPVFYKNDINWKNKKWTGTIASLPSTSEALNLDHANTIAVTHERGSVARSLQYKPATETITVITVRDPYNTCASFIERYLDNSRKRVDFTLSALRERYIEIAEAIRNNPEIIVIYYDQWLQDPQYRKKIAKRLKINPKEDSLHRIPKEGQGSSFHYRQFDGQLEQDSYLDRWKKHNDMEVWNRFVTDPEIEKIGSQFFSEIRKKVKFLPSHERKVIFGPFVGEFGVELMTWQAWCRYLAKTKYRDQRIVIATRKERNFLYEDFADEFLDVKVASVRNANGFLANIPPKDQKIKKRIVNLSDELPRKGKRWDKVRKWCRNGELNSYYHNYGKSELKKTKQILIHCRDKGNRIKANTAPGDWKEVIDHLNNHGWEVKTIGHPEASHPINKVGDLRGVSLADLAGHIKQSFAVIGVCSGPLHFAMLCGTPVISWGSQSCKRNLRRINPFDVMVYFEQVAKHVDGERSRFPTKFIIDSVNKLL